MSDNVSKFDPNPRRTIRRRIAAFVLAVLLVGGGITLYVFRDSLNLDAAKRFVRYLNVKTDETGGSFTFDSHNANQYADLQGGLAVASISGLSLYDASGKETAVVQAKLDTPAIQTGSRLTLAYDVGGNNLLAVRNSGETALSITTQRPIFDADMTSDGSVCYATSESGYKTVLYVYDANQNRIYRWLSASQYLPLCAVSPGAKLLAAVSPGQQDGIYVSNLHIFDTSSDEAGITAALSGDLIYDLMFVDADTICAVGESGAQWLSTSGSRLAGYTYDGAYLKDFDFGGDGFLSLIVNMYKAGNHCSVVTVDRTGQELGSAQLDVQILDFSAAGSYLAVLTAEKLSIYTSAMGLYYEQSNTSSATNVVMRADGSAILLGGGRGEIVLP